MIAKKVDAVIRSLIPDETYISPPVPTRRFGFHGLLVVTLPMFGPKDVAAAPSRWIVVNAAVDELAVFARTEVVSPLPGWSPSSGVNDGIDLPTLPAREALKILGELGSLVADAFFNDAELSADRRQRHAAALRSALPTALRPWVVECCRDFWKWSTR